MKRMIKRIIPVAALGLLLCNLAFCPLTLSGQEEYTKDIKKTFQARSIVELTHQYGPVAIKRSSDGEVRYEAQLQLEASDGATAQKAFDQFALNADVRGDASGDLLDLVTVFPVKDWNNRNGRIQVKFKDGTKLSNIKNLTIKATLYLPAVEELRVANKYESIEIVDPIDAALRIKLYSGRIEAREIMGDLELDMKYSKGEIGNFANGKFNLYDCSLELGNGQDLEIVAKYSNFTLGRLTGLKLDSYDDNIELETIEDDLQLTAKYSDFKVAAFENGRMEVYDCNFEIQRIGNLQIKSKYSTYDFGSAESIRFEDSYDDDLSAEYIGRLQTNSKYSDYEIEILGTSFVADASYDDNFDVDQVRDELQTIQLNGKYSELEIELPSSLPYRLDLHMTNGDFEYDEDRFQSIRYIDKDNELTAEGAANGGGASSLQITVEGYDCQVRLD